MITDKAKNLRKRLTEKQARFIELLLEGQDRADAYENAGYKPKNRLLAQRSASYLLTKHSKCIEYLAVLKENDDRKAAISRTMQLRKLSDAYDLAKSANNPSAMVSAVREANEMLGFHRDSAPNPERELAIKQREEAEQAKLQAIARRRTISIAGAKAAVNKEQSDVKAG